MGRDKLMYCSGDGKINHKDHWGSVQIWRWDVDEARRLGKMTATLTDDEAMKHADGYWIRTFGLDHGHLAFLGKGWAIFSGRLRG